ncbi:hypothetical protein ACQ4T2_25780, partial [Escherichia coli]|uniref:hypothetical protein n=1 Tax=Escherichia coli TaxID=562 RepID=UPI003D31EB8A
MRGERAGKPTTAPGFRLHPLGHGGGVFRFQQTKAEARPFHILMHAGATGRSENVADRYPQDVFA